MRETALESGAQVTVKAFPTIIAIVVLTCMAAAFAPTALRRAEADFAPKTLRRAQAAAQADRVTIRVDTTARERTMPPIWAWFGHDEPNYTYTPNGKKLLSELAAASPVPVFMRTHNLLTSGDGTAALKWGSTNAYTL